jgi:lipoprotein-anchoring transpeptidase ErfK/SrfK
MSDYYSILSRALQSPEAANAKWRRRVYDRAQRALSGQLRAQQPPLAETDIADHRAALDSAIERIEREHSRHAQSEAIAPDHLVPDQPGEFPAEPLLAPDGRLHGASIWANPISWVAIAIVVAAIGAGSYTIWSTRARAPVPQTSTGETTTASPAAPASRPASATNAKEGDLAPGVDGGSTDTDLPYYFRRQPVFYRTPNPVGTIIVDRGQRYLYFVQPNNTALRYGIAVGADCVGLAGLRKVSRKAEWPQWDPPQDMIDRKLAKPGAMAGGPGNPLGARVLELDDGTSRINGTNAPKTIGTAVSFGCIRLVNNEIEDLYARVPVGTRVVVGN